MGEHEFVHPNVIIRPIRPSDAPRLAAAHASLSAVSVRLRYLAPKPRLTAAELRYLTGIDGIDHVAFIADRAAHPSPAAAVARWVRSADDPEAAEPAVVVADDLQGQGL